MHTDRLKLLKMHCFEKKRASSGINVSGLFGFIYSKYGSSTCRLGGNADNHTLITMAELACQTQIFREALWLRVAAGPGTLE